MKTYLLTALVTHVVLVPVVAANQPHMQQQLIFPLQSKHVHSSCIVECPNGDLLCCWFHGSGERRNTDVLIQGARLRKGTQQWSDVFLMADTPDFPDCNPVLFVDAKRELWLFWIVVMAERWEHSLLRFRKAREYLSDGPPKWFWQDDMLLKPGDRFPEHLEQGYAKVHVEKTPFDRDYGSLVRDARSQLLEAARDQRKRQIGWMPRTHAIVLPTGRILLPLYSDGFYVGLMAISDDQGTTWRASSPIVGVGLNQPSVVRRRDGALVAYMREEGELTRRVQKSISRDNGETWSVANTTDIPNPNSSLEVLALEDGRWVMVYNDLQRGRDRLAVALSQDEGATWKWQRYLDRLEGGQFHYPSIIQSRDGVIHVTYTYQPGANAKKSIKHVALNAEWLMQ